MENDGHFSVTCDTDDGRSVLRAEGEIDLYSVEQLAEAFSRDDVRDSDIVLDLRDVNFIDSSGLGVIVRQHRASRENDHTFAIVTAGSENVERILELSALFQLIPRLDDVDGLEATADIRS